MKLYEKTYNTAFKEHTYSHTTIGFWEDVVDMPNQYEYSLEFFDRWYRPEYSTIIVVGDVTQDKVNSLAREYFGEWEPGTYKQEIPVEPEQNETRYAHIQEENFPPVLSLNYKGPAFTVENLDMAALDVIGSLAFSERSDIYKKLVVDERKVRQLNAGGFNTVDPGLWSVDAILVNKEDMTEVKNEIDEFYSRAKMLIISSRREGGPRVALEALLRGIKVISTKVGHMPDILDGRYLCNPNSLDDLSELLKNSINQISTIDQSSAFEKVRADFTFTKANNSLLSIYTNLLDSDIG